MQGGALGRREIRRRWGRKWEAKAEWGGRKEEEEEEEEEFRFTNARQ